MSDKRFPASVYRVGEEPDPRFSLANERTFLAWIRTSLALLAVGIAIEALRLPINPTLRFIVAAIFVVLAALAAVSAWLTWARAERAMRLGQPLPGPRLAPVLVGGVVVAVVLMAIGMFV